MKILITGAGGFIGETLVEYLLNSPDVDLLVATDRVSVTPSFQDDGSKKWISKDPETSNKQWWMDTIENNDIEKVFFLDSLENWNIFQPTEALLNRLQLSEYHFMDYLEQRVNAIKLKVIFLSTDKVYKSDKYPWEAGNVTFPTSGDGDLFGRYAQLKFLSENKFLTVDTRQTIEARVIRPFGLTGPNQSLEYPVPKMVKRFLDETPTDIQDGISYLDDGGRGLSFTHVNDIIDFTVSEQLFDPVITSTLKSKVINFCRVWNYLSEIQLLEKIKNKTESILTIGNGLSENNFVGAQSTPQIQNMQLVGIPGTSIEMILEDIIYHYEPQNRYAPLIVQDITWVNSIPTVSGTAEPLSVIGIQFGDGTADLVDTDANGVWSLTKEEELTFDSVWYIMATTNSDNQYQTLSIDVPSPGNP